MARSGRSFDEVVSIHVPVKGTTRFQCFPIRMVDVSIHVPVKGTTCAPRVSLDWSQCFNPRPREGDDVDAGRVQTSESEFQSTSP